MGGKRKQKCRECFWLKRRAALPGKEAGAEYLTVREETFTHQVSVYTRSREKEEEEALIYTLQHNEMLFTPRIFHLFTELLKSCI